MGNDMNVPVLTIDSNGEGSLEMSLDVERDDELNPGPTLRRVQAEFEKCYIRYMTPIYPRFRPTTKKLVDVMSKGRFLQATSKDR